VSAGRRELTNGEIADRLELFSALLELGGASPFAARAYRRVSQVIRALPASAAELAASGRIRELRGIGPGIEAKIREFVDTGEIDELTSLERELDPHLVGFGRALGLRPRRTLEIARTLGVVDAASLRNAIEDGRLRAVPGIGPVTEATLRERLAQPLRAPRGLTLDRSLRLSRAIADALGGVIAGPARRYAELADEVVVVCTAIDPTPTLDRLEHLPAVVTVVERSPRRAVGVTLEGVPVTVWVAEPSQLGTELVRATGSDEFVRGLGSLPDAADEESVFALLGVPYRPPELREAGASNAGRPLVEPGDVRGDLHCHTTWSDGRASVLEMARGAVARGYDYLAICDHTPAVRVVHGLDAAELERQAEEIAETNELVAPFRVLRGVECDIRADGTLDLDDRTLSRLDWVQASLHAGQPRPAAELTKIVTEAMRNPHVRALSHPKGRILGRRPENALELDEVFRVATETGVALEVNGLPDRLDLSGEHVREALAAGVELVLSSDAHSVRGLDNLDLAVATARRGGAPASAVVNCRPAAGLAGHHRAPRV
jgi:DNA polymerase (family 10)